MRGALLLLATVLAACSGEHSRRASSPTRAADSSGRAFALVQTRGQKAMGVDQYSSTHQFESLPDGGRITLQRDSDDSAGAAQIRHHMQAIALAFARGNFELPGFVHDREVPGTAVMTQRWSRISYLAESLPRGAQLRIRSRDSTTIAAIHDFLAFQRRDHRAGPGAAH